MLLLLLLIILVMLTLSQILVVHNGRYGKSVHSMRKVQLELRQMDLNLHALMMQNVPSIELSRRLLQNEINANRVARILAEASKPNQSAVPPRARTGGGADDSGQHHLHPHHHTRELHSQHYYPAHDITLDLDSPGAQGSPQPSHVNRTSEPLQPYPLSSPLTVEDQGAASEGEEKEEGEAHASMHIAMRPSGAAGHSSPMNLNHSCCNETFIMTDPRGQSTSTAVYKPAVITPSNRSKLKYCPSIPPDLSEYDFPIDPVP